VDEKLKESFKSSPVLRQLFVTKDNDVVIGQAPNAPIFIFLGSLLGAGIASFFGGPISSVFIWLALASLWVWGLLELLAGVNLFRRLLGMAALFGVVAYALAPLI
jgi:hypothetical protein